MRKLTEWTPPRDGLAMCQGGVEVFPSEDTALYFEALEDWSEAIPLILRELGIRVSALLEACDVFGDAAAFLALLVIDRKRFHPVTPVRSPGGTLRAFTARARRDEQNLTRAVLGI